VTVSAHEARTYLALGALVAVLWITTLSLRPLFNTDEGRYAEIPREMLDGHDWIVPHLDGLAYIEKPPLQYWATAASLAVVGETELGARLYTALCALCGALIVGIAAARLWGAAAGVRAAAVLASMLLFIAMGQLLTLDMSLTFYLTAVLAAFLWAQDAARRGRLREERAAMLFAWLAAALGVLTKGLIAVAIPGAVLALYSVAARDLAPWRRLHAALGLPLFLAVSVPWFWLASDRLPDFLEFFFVREHIARYLTPIANREEAFWFYGAVFLLGTLPWTLPALRAVFCGWRRDAAGGGFRASLFLKIWVLFVCLFFSLSSSKLIPYILPALPAGALLIASSPEEVLKRDLLHTALITLAAALVLGVVCALAPRYVAHSERSGYFLAMARPAAQVAVLLAASGMYVIAQRRRDLTRGAVFLSVGWCLAGLLLARAAAAVAPVYSGVVLARALPRPPATAPLYSVGTYDQTLPFYWRRTVRLAAYRGELDYGLSRAPLAELPSVEAFVTRWSTDTDADADGEAYAVMDRSTFEELARRGVPMRELARDMNRVLVARH
jgi:4-amino-4-deoxy-L-arabinose transferase-like glycosyltransferase